MDMKPKYILPVLLGGIALATLGLVTRQNQGLVVHEWGTFTSIQGSDGVLLEWRPLQSSQLPRFVHDWKKPGLNRMAAAASPFTKSVLMTLQRMETPVVYFYSEKEQTVDLSVDFPKGTITEWYPQVREIGPSYVPVSPQVASMDNTLHKMGIPGTFTLASYVGEKAITKSTARWAHLEIMPAKKHPEMASRMLSDSAGSHYFAARETDAAYVRSASLSKTNPAPENEKFLFYRGAGSFATPLVAAVTNNAVVLRNQGKEPLKHLFVLSAHEHEASFVYVDQLAPGESRTVPLQEVGLPLDRTSAEISKAMEDALVKEGLFQREARAMVNTWNNSWFDEEGVRVLYLLPRNWTDATLPMTVSPQPKNIVRVMVGRAELITPATENQLASELVKASQGDAPAREEAQAMLRKLGRFAEPVFNRAMTKASPTANKDYSFVSVLVDAQGTSPGNLPFE
jgi:hypothetical protein